MLVYEETRADFMVNIERLTILRTFFSYVKLVDSKQK